MPFQIIRDDITRVRADAIVNTANPYPCIGRGTDGAIYAAAGAEQLLAARQEIGRIAPGQAAHTAAFRLRARYILHTVGPAWIDGNHGEREILHACYANALLLAAELQCSSVAFPLIASGVYGFPKDEALHIALTEIERFLLTREMQVILVVFDPAALQLSQRLVGEIEQYMDDRTVNLLGEAEYGSGYAENGRGTTQWETAALPAALCREQRAPARAAAPVAAPPAPAEKSLEEMLGGTGETFQQRLFALIDASGMDDVTVYKKANIDRKVFSRIRCKADYKPKKKTAVAFAVALELDMAATQDLLSRAELAFSPSSRFDLIVTYFITHRIYDIFQINAALFRYGQPILGE